MRIALLSLLFAALPLAVSAKDASPVGRWKTIDDETGKVKSIVEITQAADGTLQGKVVEILQSDRGPTRPATSARAPTRASRSRA